MSDLIDRQAAIDAFNTNLNELVVGGEKNAKTVENYLNRVLDKIKCLPSALGTNLAEVGTDCSEFPNNSDAISRKAAIDALDKRFDSISMEQTSEILLLRKDLREMPPIQPKRGRWLYCEDTTADCVDGYRCDQCGFFTPWDYQHKSIDYIKDYNFCPNCGAKMEGADDE